MSEVARLWCDDVVMFNLTVVEYVVYMCLNKPLDLVLEIGSALILCHMWGPLYISSSELCESAFTQVICFNCTLGVPSEHLRRDKHLLISGQTDLCFFFCEERTD